MAFFLKLLLRLDDLNLLCPSLFFGELLFLVRFYDSDCCRPGTWVLCRRSGLSGMLDCYYGVKDGCWDEFRLICETGTLLPLLVCL